MYLRLEKYQNEIGFAGTIYYFTPQNNPNLYEL